ncbi:MAG: DoxX family protein, partial [Bacteroidales bacterium]|nr:DoxX family protein [Bacteroidales bacterium]
MENSRISTRIRFLFTFLIIAIGWHLLYEGIVKILDPYWSADSFLAEASGPFAGLFHKMASNPGLLRVIDVINIAGLTAIGLMLMLGLFTRYAAIAGALLLSMYYLANPSWVASRIGFGVEGNYMVVNKNLIEVVMLVLIASIPPNWYYGIHHLLFKKSGRRNLDSNTIEQGNADTGRRQLIKNLTFLPFMGGFVFSVLRNLKNHPDAVSSATAVWDSSKIEGLTKLNHPPNEPMGIAQGIFPGRVVWVHNPDATNRNCTNTSSMNGLLDEQDDAWFMDKNTSQDHVDKMLTDGILSVSGKEDIAGAWQKVFETHNQKRGKGITGYREGE